jgi:nucleoside-diphosphate-sugar epimerase
MNKGYYYKILFLTKNIVGETINLGTGKSISIKETVKIIQNLMKTNKKVKFDKKRLRPKKSEVDNLVAENTKAKRLLNWNPEYVGKVKFEKLIIEVLDWYKKNKKIFNSEIFNI